MSLRHAPISVHVSKGASARHRIQFNRSPERADKEWEENQLRKHLGPTVRMCLFEHVEGSTVCQGLFKHFTLPNGKTVHYYHEDMLHEIVASTVVKPPRPPLALKDIFQDNVPGTDRGRGRDGRNSKDSRRDGCCSGMGACGAACRRPCRSRQDQGS